MNKICVADVNAYLSLNGRRAVNIGEIAELLQERCAFLTEENSELRRKLQKASGVPE